MSEMIKKNQLNWDDRVDIHLESESYDLAAFRAGKSTLKAVELSALGDVTGKSILHLQCHIGLDTLSLARLGAKATGMDLSGKSIEAARTLAKDLNINAEFIPCDLYDLPKHLNRQFDVVMTTYGVLCWMADLPRWAEIVASYMKPGATFLIVESHPVADALSQQGNEYKMTYSYFDSGPEKYENEKTYVPSDKKLANPITYQWTHSLSDIVNALLQQGLAIEKLEEFPYTFFQRFPNMKQNKDGWFILPDERKDLPLMFALKASKK